MEPLLWLYYFGYDGYPVDVSRAELELDEPQPSPESAPPAKLAEPRETRSVLRWLPRWLAFPSPQI